MRSIKMCGPKKYPYAPQGVSLEIPGDLSEGNSQATGLKETIKLNLS